MISHSHSISPIASPDSSPSAPSTSTSAPSPSLVALSFSDQPIIDSQQHTQHHQQPPQRPQLTRELQQQQVQLQQLLLLQQQQQQAQLQLQNLKILQKKQLLAEQQQRFQQQHQQQSLRHKSSSASVSLPILLQAVPPPPPPPPPPSPPSTIVEPVYFSGSAVFPPLKQEAPPQLPGTTVTTSAPYPSFAHPYLNVAPTTATNGTTATVHTTSIRSHPPSLLRASVPTTASMDIIAMAPFPLHQHRSLSSNPLVLQQPIEQLATLSILEQQQQQGRSSQHLQSSSQQQQRQQLHGLVPINTYYHPLAYESSQGPPPIAMNYSGPGYPSQGWIHPDNTMLNINVPLLSPGTQMLQGLPASRTSTSDAAIMRAGAGFQQELSGYSIDARIIQKKDQMEESSTGGDPNVVEEVRTGQQFLIKLQLIRQAGVPPASTKYPTMRVDRREAINTAGDPRADAEPLTLQIIVHLARSGQIRKGACAKCCHKYGPSSPILVLLDPLSPSVTSTSSYAHVDSSTGSVTFLAKVICSSTDHGERGNKDRYFFEFRLRRTSSMLSRNSADMGEDEVGTVATCFTAPIMCSGHHKAKRVYPSQRPAKITKEGPVPKTKAINRQRSVPSVTTNNGRQISTDHNNEFLRSGSISSTSSYPSQPSFMQDNITNSSMVSNFRDDQSNDFDTSSSTISSQQPLIGMSDVASEPQSQPPRIFEVRPDRGPIRKTTDVALRGLFFQEGMVPYFGCFPAQDIIVETSNLILCKAPECPLKGTVDITIYDTVGNIFADLDQFTYTDDTETELLILQLQLRLAHRALEYLHAQTTGRRGDANDILKEIPGLGSSNMGEGSSSGGNMMSDSVPTDEELVILTREQVEDGLLTTLDQLPAGMDISFQLEDQGNLLHLSVLMSLDRLTLRLIEEGCELDALDSWAMTPLMYAIVKGNETIVRSLVIAGASSSGARTPSDFYSFLPRPVVPTAAVTGYLAVSCTRHSTTSRTWTSSRSRGQPDIVEIENDEGSISTASNTASNSDAEDPTTDSPQEALPTFAEGQTVDNDDEQSMALLAERIRGVHLNRDMPPLDQQDLPPMHVMGSDGSITINNKVLKGDDIPRGVIPGSNTITTDNEESGYHSGVYSEVQDRLRLLHEASLPSAGVEMSVAFNKLMSSSSSPAALSSGPENLFRTGDSFGIEIRLATIPIPDSIQPQPTLPKEFLGIRFPHEMVKRVGGRSTSILNEMTYILETNIELGQSASLENPHDHDHAGGGTDLIGSCNSCSKFLHEHRRLSPSRVSAENPSAYPILQFSVPAAHTEMIQTAEGEAVGAQDALTFSTGVMELRDGQVEVRARVNCSSLHQLIQRDKARRTTEMPTSLMASAPGSAVDFKDLEDPGYVFHFRLVHPTLHTVVARFSTGPILFQSFSRGRA